MNIIKIKRALSGKKPFTEMYGMIPDKKKKAFIEFAKSFGLDEKKLKEILDREAKNDSKEEN